MNKVFKKLRNQQRRRDEIRDDTVLTLKTRRIGKRAMKGSEMVAHCGLKHLSFENED